MEREVFGRGRTPEPSQSERDRELREKLEAANRLMAVYAAVRAIEGVRERRERKALLALVREMGRQVFADPRTPLEDVGSILREHENRGLAMRAYGALRVASGLDPISFRRQLGFPRRGPLFPARH